MKKILITGGAGNIGGSLAARLVNDENNFVVIVDDLSTGAINKLPGTAYKNCKFIKADLNSFNDIAPVMFEYKFDLVFHFAAVVGVSRTLNNPLRVLKDIDGIRNILELSNKTAVKRVFYSSSSEVYGEPVSLPQHEEDTPLNSRLPYAIVKNVGEAFFKTYQQEFGLTYTIFRFFNTYGPGQSEDFVVPRFLKAALKNEDIHIYGDGSQTRTFCYVDDTIDAIVELVKNDAAKNQTLNMGSDVEISIIELAKTIIDLTNSNSNIIHRPALEEGDMTRRQPDISKMKAYLKGDLTSLHIGIKRMINNYNSNSYDLT